MMGSPRLSLFSRDATTWPEDEEVKKEQERENGEDVQNERSGFVGGWRWIPWMMWLFTRLQFWPRPR